MIYVIVLYDTVALDKQKFSTFVFVKIIRIFELSVYL